MDTNLWTNDDNVRKMIHYRVSNSSWGCESLRNSYGPCHSRYFLGCCYALLLLQPAAACCERDLVTILTSRRVLHISNHRWLKYIVAFHTKMFALSPEETRHSTLNFKKPLYQSMPLSAPLPCVKLCLFAFTPWISEHLNSSHHNESLGKPSSQARSQNISPSLTLADRT